MGGRSSVLAVVDASEAGPVVWWVNLGTAGGLTGRLCGAWVLGEGNPTRVADLLAGRMVLATSAGGRVVAGSAVDTRGAVDPDGTLAAVIECRDELQDAYQARVAERTRSNAPVEPTWPAMPDRLDPEAPSVVDAPEPLRRALGIARWFDRLCRTWDAIEGQRLARNYMRVLGGPNPRVLPVAVLGTPGR
ncbi:MAG TPA: hypothetical protein VFX16_18265 [Pseudonocardiaceae bacterium]|nr:hypothetical protein [Pseudonocardiaceae bacterium]